MVQKMPGQLSRLKSRKRKRSSEVKSSRKEASATRRRYTRSSKMPSAAESSAVVGGYSKSDGPLERLSLISCECLQSAGRRRCTASPEPEGGEGKENEPRTGLDLDSCSANGTLDKQEHEDMEFEETRETIFPDDDSNQILPVEQFFGNLDVVQDFPQKPSTTSGRVQREGRRRHYYAREDSDDGAAGLGSIQREDGGDT